MKPEEATLASLLSIEGNQWHYHIPKYQREYSWGKSNWGKLLEDIYDNAAGHYMGSIICVHDKEESTPNKELIYDVVDGQQRLTTISLLLMAIYYNLNNDAVKAAPEITKDSDFADALNSIRKKLVKKTAQAAGNAPLGSFRSDEKNCYLRVQPSTQFHNLEDYKYILGELGLIDEQPYPKHCGNRSLYRTYCYFCDQIPKNWIGLKELLDRVNRLAFILISETSHSKAFILFETLNNRGVPLSGIDIIKNKVLSELESKHNKDIEDSYAKWQNLLRYLPTYDDQDRFLRHFYNAFKFRDDIKVEGTPKATSSTVIKIYETLIKRDAISIFNELTEKAKIYNQLIEPEKHSTPKVSEALIDLERIGAAASYSFLLYLFSLPQEQLENPSVCLSTVNLFSKYYLRRNVTDFPNTRDLDAINIDLIDQCQKQLTDKKKLSFEFIERALLSGRGKPQTTTEFKKILADNLFSFNDGMARYLLAKLDETSHTREYKPDLWARNEKGKLVWTVEHILPQGKLTKEWIEMIGNGDRSTAEEIQNSSVHSLGNLTLSGYNSKLSNQPFLKKKTKAESNVFGNKIKIGYENGLAINAIEFYINGKTMSLANAAKWSAEMIEARNTVMVDLILKLFEFDSKI